MLLIAAVALAGGIFLLDLFYLRPQVTQKQDAALREQVSKVQQAGNLGLQVERKDLALQCSQWAAKLSREGARPTDAAIAKTASTLNLDLVILADNDATHRQSWPAGTTSKTALTQPHTQVGCLGHALDKVAISGEGLIVHDSGLYILSAAPTQFDSHPGHLWVGRRVAGDVQSRLASATGSRVDIILAPGLPKSVVTSDSSAMASWMSEDDQTLTVAWMLHDINGTPAGYVRCDVPTWQLQRQTSTVRRAVLIILSLSVGLVLLVIVGTHVLVAGPVVRLLRRLQLLENGDGRKLDLCRDLHGEPLVLARRLENAFERLAHLSKTDQLTQLANRRNFEEVLNAFYQQARRYNRPLSVMIIDVDFFKAVNDAGGHQAGDQMLKAISQCLEQVCRKADLPARWGGDEFAVLLPETTCSDAGEVAERIRQAVAQQQVPVRGTGVKISLSIGIADLNAGEIDSPERMIALADRALYTAKEMGRDRVVQAHDLNGLTWPDSSESSAKVDVLCQKLAGLDNQIKDLFLRAVEELVTILEQRDPYMAMHARKVQHFAVLIGKEMGLPERMHKRLEIAAMLHDIGMIAMPDSILLSAGSLNEQQMQVMRRHPLLSVRIMEGMEFLDQEVPAVRYHHERFDGQGYPEGLAGSQIPLTARVLAVADALVAITSPRAFRGARTLDQAVEEIRQGSGTHFDPAVVDAFVSLAEREKETLLDVPEAPTRTSIRSELLEAALREEC